MANQVVHLWETVLANLADMANSTTDFKQLSHNRSSLAK